MNARKTTSGIVLFLLIFLACAGLLSAQMNEMNAMYRFRNVAVPVDLVAGAKVLPMGNYDLEFVRVPTSRWYFVRIMKRGKILHTVQGEEQVYDAAETIPKEPKLHMSLNRGEKKLNLVFESGWGTEKYGNIRARFSCDFQ